MTQITIEAGRMERHYWKDLWRYRELCLAGHPGALQADGDWRGLGVDPSVADDGGVHGGVRQAGQAARRCRSAVSHHGLCGHAAVAVLRHGVCRGGQQPHQQCEHDIQGLFPPPDDSRQRRHRELRGFPDFFCHPDRPDGVVSFPAGCSHPVVAAVHAGGLCGIAGRRAVDCGAECPLPRFAIHRAVRGAATAAVYNIRRLCYPKSAGALSLKCGIAA